MKYWFGIGEWAVWNWRRKLGVDRKSNPGTRRLMAAASAQGAAATRGVPLPPEAVEEGRCRAKRLNLARFLPQGGVLPCWTKEQTALLGKLPDEEVARRIGRTASAVRVRRSKLGILTARDRRRKGQRS